MDFETWWKNEGSLMREGGCNTEITARAAWFVATHNKEPDVRICIENPVFDKEVIAAVCRSIAEDGTRRAALKAV